jgi:UDP-N-acetylmuramoyl-tripeptide--D-alanyl-D-alanine ligase
MLEALWLAEDAAEATGGKLLGSDSWIASGISIDTRSLAPGDLFVALQDQRDGHDFLGAAFAAGAVAALVSNAQKAAGHGPCLLVDDVLKGLRCLGAGARDRSAALRVAITGSVGKTSTKEAVAACLSASARTHASVKSFNNHWGVPLTLARMAKDARFGVFEMGMNHRHEIAPLTELVAPHIAMVTWIAPAHIENLGTLEAIADEKGDIFAGLPADGAALVPNEAPHADRLIKAAGARRVVRFGREAGCEARLLRFDAGADGSDAEAEILGRRVRYRIGAEGVHWATNSLAALATTVLANADLDAAIDALARFETLAGRGQAIAVSTAFGAFTLVDDSYNANPASMAAAFESLKMRTPAHGGRRIVALGDMLELGEREADYHRGLAEPILSHGLDLVFAAGPRMKALWEALPADKKGGYAEDAESLSGVIASALQTGDVVLVKGSNGSRMFKVVAALKALSQTM